MLPTSLTNQPHPALLNCRPAVCRALREAAARGFTCAVTGDAADELFGGYNFTHRLEPAAWEHNRQRMALLLHFGSVPLGELQASPALLPV